MKTTKRNKRQVGQHSVVAMRLHGFAPAQEQFAVAQDFEMAAGFYDHRDSWNQMLINTMHNMRVSCQFFN
jgi:hypothetical protein